MDGATLFFGLLWWLFGRGRAPEAPRGGSTVEPRALPAPASPPWPQVVPTGLPSFPGAGWTPDEPPPLAVQQRAGQLLSTLWNAGKGRFTIEKTEGRWIAYQADLTRGNKRGVIAYRLKPAVVPPAVIRATPVQPAATRAPASVPVSVSQRKPAVSAFAPQLPLRYGMGLKPAAPVAEVRMVQQKLSIADDGRFGSGTLEAVKAFQRRKSLLVDGVVGEQTWTALFGVKP